MGKAALVFSFLVAILIGCADKPTQADMEKKLLQNYVCPDKARVKELKVLRTEETKSTGGPHLFRFTVRGEVEWPTGCNQTGTITPAGTKEPFERLLTLYKSDKGQWE